ncbi:MAG: hypothetical protein ACYDHH_25670 [Solirubrobacteraceae bacterium]
MLQRDSVVRWTVSSGTFALRDASGRLNITGSGPRGGSFAPAGRYIGVSVRATGAWTLTITPIEP